MRHRVKNKRLGRMGSHRKRTLQNLARAVFFNQSIKTTKLKAKEARVLVANLITIAKKNTPHHQRLAFSIVPDKTLVKELFKEIAPRFQKRNGGYTRIIPLNFRRGDGADMVIFELTEKKVVKEKPKVKKEPAKAKKLLGKKEPAAKKTAGPKKEERQQESKVAPKPKVQVAQEIAKEKAKGEEKKIQKGFLKGVRRFFQRRTP